MRLRQCQRPRATSRIFVAFGIVLSSAVAVFATETASAATLGAFEVRLSDTRAAEGHEQIEYALANSGVPVVMSDQAADEHASDKDPEAKVAVADGEAKPAEKASGEPTQDDAKKPLLDAGDGEAPAPARSTTAGKSTPAAKIVVPKAGEGYYDSRAAEVLKAEVQRAIPANALQYEPGTSVVVCVGGCSSGHMGVVFVQTKAEAPPAQAGEMEQSSTSGPDAVPAARPDEIACIAGCYDDAPRLHPALPAERTKQELQDAIDRARSGARKSSAKPDDDWQTAPKAKSSVNSSQARRHAARARHSEKPGAWFTRIIKSREPEKGEPEKE